MLQARSIRRKRSCGVETKSWSGNENGRVQSGRMEKSGGLWRRGGRRSKGEGGRVVVVVRSVEDDARGSGGSDKATSTSAAAAAAAAQVHVDSAAAALDEKKAETLLPLVAWLGATAGFGACIAALQGSEKAGEYFAGYLLEQALSVDNLIVFVLIFDFFKVPLELQGRVLNYGIWGAAVLRLAFILAGAEALERFEPVLLVFAAILIFSSYKILSEAMAEGGDGEDDSLAENAIVKFCMNAINSTDVYDGDRFFNAAGQATPLFLALLVIELSDVVFAVDSVPAIFGVTRDPFIVYSSSMFAILSLRAVYNVFSAFAKDLAYLETAVGLILGFIGAKIVGSFVGVDISTTASLIVVIGTMSGGIAASYAFPQSTAAEKEK